MATDYDAPRKTDDDSDSIEALKERVPDKMSGQVDVDDADNPGSFQVTINGAGGVPEASTWAMMLAGFGGIGGAMRMARRKQAAVAA